MDMQNLKQIGLTEGEIKVYESLLAIGECTKTRLAKQSKIAPSNIYDITNRLLEKGIISKVEKNGVAHFSPADPKHLLDFINKKEQEIVKEKAYVNQILPTLLAQFTEIKESIHVQVFQGWNGLKTIFEELIFECSANDECYVFGASKGTEEAQKQSDIFFPKYSIKREKKGIITYILYNEDLRTSARFDFMRKSRKYKMKYLNQSTPAEIMFYKNKSCIIILTKEPLVIRITSQEVRDSFKQYFDVLWKQAKE